MKESLKEKIEAEFGKIICEFPILHHEWELDGSGFIVESNKGRVAVLTNHNIPYISSIQEIQNHIAFYKTTIQQTERCLFLLNGEND